MQQNLSETKNLYYPTRSLLLRKVMEGARWKSLREFLVKFLKMPSGCSFQYRCSIKCNSSKRLICWKTPFSWCFDSFDIYFLVLFLPYGKPGIKIKGKISLLVSVRLTKKMSQVFYDGIIGIPKHSFYNNNFSNCARKIVFYKIK